MSPGRGLSPLWFLALSFLALAPGALSAEAQSFAYITARPNSVTVINTSTDRVVATVTVGNDPFGVAITPDGTSAYVANSGSGSVSVIDTTSRMVVATIIVGGSRVYATGSCGGCNSVQVIGTASDPVVDIVAPLDNSVGVAVTPQLPEPGPLPPVFSKVVVIMLENTEFDEIINNADAPFFNQLASQYGLATNYFAITHPSFPNYLATIGGDTFGITENCEDLSVCNRPEPFPSNLADQIEASGRTWVAYMEDMPGPCYIGSSGLYAQKHNPFIYFDTIRLRPERCANIQPYDPAGPLADFTWITPTLCNDMHDCPISTGDAWLQDVVSGILAQPEFQPDGPGVLFITFDEGFGQNRVATLVIGPLVKPGYQSNVSQNHYSLLHD